MEEEKHSQGTNDDGAGDETSTKNMDDGEEDDSTVRANRVGCNPFFIFLDFMVTAASDEEEKKKLPPK